MLSLSMEEEGNAKNISLLITHRRENFSFEELKERN